MPTQFFDFCGREVTSGAFGGLGPTAINLTGLFKKVRALSPVLRASRVVAEGWDGKFFLLISRHCGAWVSYDEIPLSMRSLEDAWASRVVRTYFQEGGGDLWDKFLEFTDEDQMMVLESLFSQSRNAVISGAWEKNRNFRLIHLGFPSDKGENPDFYPDEIKLEVSIFRNFPDKTLQHFLYDWNRIKIPVLLQVIKVILAAPKDRSWPPKRRRMADKK